MLRFLKFLALLGSGIFIVGSLTVIGFVTLLDPNDLKSMIRQQVFNTTGRVLTIQGKVRLSLNPHPTLEINEAILNNAPTYSNEFLKIQKIVLAPKLLSLFSGKLFADLRLEGLDLHLETRANGNNNWKDIKKNVPFPFLIQRFDLNNAHITLKGHKPHQHYAFNNLNFSADNLALGFASLFSPLSSNFILEDLDRKKSAHIKLNAVWQLNVALNQLDFQNISLESHMENVTPLQINGEFRIENFFKKEKSLKEMSIKDMSVKERPIFSGKIQTASFDLNAWLKELGQKPKDFIPKDFTLTASFHYQNSILEVHDFSSQFENISTLAGNLKFHIKERSLTGSFKAKQLQIGSLPFPEIKGTIKTSKDLISFESLELDIAKSRHKGSVEIQFKDKIPHYTLLDQTNDFNLNELLSLFNAQDKIQGLAQFNANLTTHGKTLEELKTNLSGEATIQLNQGKLSGIDLISLLNHTQSTIKGIQESLNKKHAVNLGAILTAELSEWRQQAQSVQRFQTPFDTLQANLSIANGLIHNSDLKIAHSKYLITGQGTLNLINNEIQYQANTLLQNANANPQTSMNTLPKSALPMGTSIGNDLPKDIPLGIELKGSLENPSLRPLLEQHAKTTLRLPSFSNSTEDTVSKKALEKLFDIP